MQVLTKRKKKKEKRKKNPTLILLIATFSDHYSKQLIDFAIITSSYYKQNFKGDLTRGIDPSSTLRDDSVAHQRQCALARTGVCVRGDVPPSEAGKFFIFATGIVQFGKYF